MEERSQHRREEKEWLAERTSLSRRLQLLDRLGLDRLQPAGQKTEGRLESRLDQPIQYFINLKQGLQIWIWGWTGFKFSPPATKQKVVSSPGTS